MLVSAFATIGQSAVSVSLHSSNQGIGSFSFHVVGSTIQIEETWTGFGPGRLQFSGLGTGSWTIEKTIHNNSGAAWTRLPNELLDPAGDQNDFDRDPMPYPAHVPAGFSTSNDWDGLTFHTSPISSSVWSSYLLDIDTDARDFLDFYDGTLADGATGTVTYDIYDSGANQPFLLSQRPNLSSSVIPEPTSAVIWALLCLAGSVVGVRRWRNQTR
jgi:hypothetical protein